MKTKFPLPHIVKEETKEVWILTDSSITAMGIPALVKQYYPGYIGKVASKDYFARLKNESTECEGER